MADPIPLTELVVLYICPNCNFSGCRMCNGTGRVPHDPYRRGGGEQGDDFEDVVNRTQFNQARQGREQEEAGHG